MGGALYPNVLITYKSVVFCPWDSLVFLVSYAFVSNSCEKVFASSYAAMANCLRAAPTSVMPIAGLAVGGGGGGVYTFYGIHGLLLT